MRIVAVDTETVWGKPWSVQMADEDDPHGVIGYCDDASAMRHTGLWLEDDGVLTVLHNAKFDLRVLAQCGIHPAHTECTMQMAYLLGEPRLSLKVLAYRLAGIEMQTYEEVTRDATQTKARAYLQQVADMDWPDPDPIMTTAKDGSTKLSFPKNIKNKVQRLLDKASVDPSINLYDKWRTMEESGGRGQVEMVVGRLERAYLDEVDPQEAQEYACLDATATFAIYPYLHAEIERLGLQGALERDMDCIPMVIEMEDNGVLLDVAELELLRHDLDELSDNTQDDINYLAGRYVNPRSSQQVVALLQDEGIYTDLETSTDASVLDQYREHVIVNKIQDYRAYTKLQSTYVEGLMKAVGADGRIHTQYSMTRTETGRLASCLPGDVRIPTSDGTKRLRDVVAGDYVWTHTRAWKEVLNKFDNGMQAVFRIHLCNGSNVECTSNHRLLTNQGWLSLEDIYERMQETCTRSEHLRECIEGLSWRRETYNRSNGEGVWGNISHSHDHIGKRASYCGVSTRKRVKICQKQNRKQEPHEGAISGDAPKLQGRNPRKRWLFNYLTPRLVHRTAQQQARTASPSSYVREVGYNGDTARLLRSPHQWGCSGQPLGESCIGVGSGTQGNAPSFSSILQVEYVGTVRVYDLEIETDHCYLANGIYVHNSKPNLQNIPVRTELGRRIRKAFVAQEGCSLLAFDLSQIELRVAAHESQDPTMLDIFHNDGDMHMMTACAMFGLPPEKIDDKTHRRPAKTCNFGTIYLISAKGLWAQFQHEGLTQFSEDDCQSFLDSWRRTYPGFFDWVEEISAEARRTGMVRDMFGRIRWIPELQSSLKYVREAGIRQAVNAPIQSGAGGILKEAMRHLHPLVRQWREDYGIVCRSLLQVHDELIFEVEDEYIPIIVPQFYEVMVGAVELSVPVKVDCEKGKNWKELEAYQV